MYRSCLLKLMAKVHACELALNHPRASFRRNVSAVGLTSLGFMTAIDMGGTNFPCPGCKRRWKGGTLSALLEMFVVYTTHRWFYSCHT